MTVSGLYIHLCPPFPQKRKNNKAVFPLWNSPLRVRIQLSFCPILRRNLLRLNDLCVNAFCAPEITWSLAAFLVFTRINPLCFQLVSTDSKSVYCSKKYHSFNLRIPYVLLQN